MRTDPDFGSLMLRICTQTRVLTSSGIVESKKVRLRIYAGDGDRAVRRSDQVPFANPKIFDPCYADFQALKP